jgi:hypothetical protein
MSLFVNGGSRVVSFLLLSAFSSRIRLTVAYPLIVQVDEGAERCFRFNVPAKDDGHFLAMILPHEDQLPDHHDELERWYVDQLFQMTTLKTKAHPVLPRELVTASPPTTIATIMSEFLQKHATHHQMKILITDNPAADHPVYHDLQNEKEATNKYFEPIVLNHVSKFFTTPGEHHHPQHQHHHHGQENLEGYGICFHNDDKEHPIHVAFDIILSSEQVVNDKIVSTKKTDFDKERHLTPLERTLDLSISAAHSVAREMKYMEQREARMRRTAESINARVRWFSYLSAAVLLVVTYVQVAYLKRYFHKKKLM